MIPYAPLFSSICRVAPCLFSFGRLSLHLHGSLTLRFFLTICNCLALFLLPLPSGVTSFWYLPICDREGVQGPFRTPCLSGWYLFTLPIRAGVWSFLPQVDVPPGAPQVVGREPSNSSWLPDIV